MHSPQKSENFPQSTWRFGLKEPIILNRSIGKGYKNSRQTYSSEKILVPVKAAGIFSVLF